MVVQKAVDNLKDRPKDEKTVVAGGIAITVVIILLIAWGFLFIKKIQRSGDYGRLDGTAQDEFNFSTVREAQQAIEEGFFDTSNQLREAREQAVSGQVPNQTYEVDVNAQNSSVFGENAD